MGIGREKGEEDREVKALQRGSSPWGWQLLRSIGIWSLILFLMMAEKSRIKEECF